MTPQIAAGGSVLDLACGSGRHTRYLLQSGFSVTAVDIDLSGVADLLGDPACTQIEFDLEGTARLPLAPPFDGIVVTNYLHRPLLPLLPGLLARRGVLIYETFMVGNERLGRPSNPDFLLRQGELREVFGGVLDTIRFEEGYYELPRPAMLQRFCGRLP